MILSFLFFFGLAQAETFSLGGPLPPPSCVEKCQYFDDFNNVCLYKTRCDYAAHCVSSTRCEYWNEFDGKCSSEQSSLLCSAFSPTQPQLTCQTSCQYWDSHSEKCDYKTSCSLQVTGPGRACMDYVSCERWDDFDRRCVSEERRKNCN